MSFWSWMRERYPRSISEWFKRLPWNFIMYFIGMMGCVLTLGTSFYYFMTENPQWGLLCLCLSGGGFILGNYGVYRQHG